MAVFKQTQVSVEAEPIKNGSVANTDEETVQAMWDAVRSNFETDMKAMQFSNLPKAQKLSWASALLRYINGNDDIQIADNEKMKTPNGGIKISRTVTITANETSALNFGPATMLARKVQTKKLLLFSLLSYTKLKDYIQSLQSQSQPQTARNLGNVFALAALMGALASLNDDDDD